MKTMDLIAKFQKLLRRAPQDSRLKKLRKTVKALKEKQDELEHRLKRTHGKHTRARLRQKIDVLRAQRRKGAAAYRELKAELEDATRAP